MNYGSQQVERAVVDIGNGYDIVTSIMERIKQVCSEMGHCSPITSSCPS